MKKKSLLAAALAASMVLPSNLSTLSLLTPVAVMAVEGEGEEETQVTVKFVTDLDDVSETTTKGQAIVKTKNESLAPADYQYKIPEGFAFAEKLAEELKWKAEGESGSQTNVALVEVVDTTDGSFTAGDVAADYTKPLLVTYSEEAGVDPIVVKTPGGTSATVGVSTTVTFPKDPINESLVASEADFYLSDNVTVYDSEVTPVYGKNSDGDYEIVFNRVDIPNNVMARINLSEGVWKLYKDNQEVKELLCEPEDGKLKLSDTTGLILKKDQTEISSDSIESITAKEEPIALGKNKDIEIAPKSDALQYKGTATVSVALKGDLSKATATFDETSYTLNELSKLEELPAPKVTFNGDTLQNTNNKDFTVAYSFTAKDSSGGEGGEGPETGEENSITSLEDITEAGTVTATITGAGDGDYAGKTDATFEVTENTLVNAFTASDVTVEDLYLTPDQDLNTKPNVTVEVEGTKLSKDTDFAVAVTTSPTKLGDKGTVTVTGTNSYADSEAEKEYNVYGDLSKATLGFAQDGDTKYELEDAPDDAEAAATALKELIEVTWGTGDNPTVLTQDTAYIIVATLSADKKSGTFTIDPADNGAYKYNGNNATKLTGSFTVKAEGGSGDVVGNKTDISAPGVVKAEGYVKLTTDADGKTQFDYQGLTLEFTGVTGEVPNTSYKTEVVADSVGATVGKLTVTAEDEATNITGTATLEGIKVVGDLTKATLGKAVEVQVEDASEIETTLKASTDLVVKIGDVALTKDTDYVIDAFNYTSGDNGTFSIKPAASNPTCEGEKDGLAFTVRLLDPEKPHLTSATVIVEDVIVGPKAQDIDYVPNHITVKVKDENDQDIIVAPADYNVITDGVTNEIGTKGTIQVTGKGDYDGTSSTSTGSYTLYGNLPQTTVTITALEISGTVDVEAVKTALANATLTVEFDDIELELGTDYVIDEDSISLNTDKTGGTFSIKAPTNPNKVKGTKDGVAFTITTQQAPQTTEVDLTNASGSVTYNEDGSFKTLTITPAGGSAITIQADANGNFAGVTLNPEKLTPVENVINPQAVTVTGKGQEVEETKTTYKNSFTIDAVNVTSATNTPEGPGQDNPDEVEVTSWVVKFEGTDAPAKSLSFTKDDVGTAEKVAVDKYLTEIPTGFHYASEPVEIDFADATLSTDKTTKTVSISIVKNGDNDTADPATDAKIKVPYTGTVNGEEVKGTLTVDYPTDSASEISSADLSTALKGGKTEDKVEVSKLKPSLYYGNETDGFTAFEFDAPTITVNEDKEATLDKLPETDTVAVELPGDLPTLDIPLKKLADNPSQATLTYEPNYEEIGKNLTQTVNDQNKEDPNKKDKLPDYIFTVKPTASGASSDTQSSNDDSISFNVADLNITITIKPTSYIRLLIPVKESPDTVMVLSDGEEREASKATTVPIIVGVAEIDTLPAGKPDHVITTQEIEAYIKTNKNSLKDENDQVIDTETLVVPKDVKLNLAGEKSYNDTVNNGYFEANIEDAVVTPTPAPRPGSSSKPSKPKPEEPVAPVATPTPMYRLYNKLNGEHLFTTDKAERDNLLTSDTWSDEGQGWTAPSVSDTPVYRLLNPNTGDHHYTTDKNEFDTLPTYGWVAEGIAFFSADKNNTENVILHRLYNPNATGAGSHHYTADTNERDTLVGQGWKYEGTAWAGLPASK